MIKKKKKRNYNLTYVALQIVIPNNEKNKFKGTFTVIEIENESVYQVKIHISIDCRKQSIVEIVDSYRIYQLYVIPK